MIRFHPTLLELSSHYCFEARPVAVARGNEKGRVERAIRYIRDNFFAARQFKYIDDLNAQADHGCQHTSADRRCPGDQSKTVRDAFKQEQPTLLALPDDPFPTWEQVPVSARKTPYIRFDLNDYSIPHTHVQKTLTVNADLITVRVLDGNDILATHTRCFDKGQQIEHPAHIDALWQHKVEAKRSRGHHRLSHASPLIDSLLEQTVARGHVLKTTINLLIECLDAYGQSELHLALEEAIKNKSPHPQGVRQILTRRREARQQPPPISIAVPEKARLYSVKPANLSDYDNIQTLEGDNHE